MADARIKKRLLADIYYSDSDSETVIVETGTAPLPTGLYQHSMFQQRVYHDPVTGVPCSHKEYDRTRNLLAVDPGTGRNIVDGFGRPHYADLEKGEITRNQWYHQQKKRKIEETGVAKSYRHPITKEICSVTEYHRAYNRLAVDDDRRPLKDDEGNYHYADLDAGEKTRATLKRK